MRKIMIVPILLLTACAGGRVAGQKDTRLTDAVASPLYDVNVIQTKIPEVLLDAVAAPYALPNPLACPEIAALVRPLDEALGPDLDAAPSLENPSMIERGGSVALGAGVSAVRSTTQGFIPMRSWVRKLTGAERHDRLVVQAVTAGAVRRGYLKGLGKAQDCLPPASPQPIALKKQPPGIYPGSEPSVPNYPIR